MDLAIDLGLSSTLHIHASGALTFCGPGEDLVGWEDDLLLSVEA
jgi:hypothetical protein